MDETGCRAAVFFLVNKKSIYVYVLNFIGHPPKTGQLLFFLIYIYIVRVSYNIAIYVYTVLYI